MLRVPERVLYEHCTSIVRVLYVVDEDSFSDETLRFRGRRVGGAFKNLNFTSRASWGEIEARGGEHRQLEALSMKKSECRTGFFLAMSVGTMQYSSGFYLNKTP